MSRRAFSTLSCMLAIDSRVTGRFRGKRLHHRAGAVAGAPDPRHAVEGDGRFRRRRTRSGRVRRQDGLGRKGDLGEADEFDRGEGIWKTTGGRAQVY